MIRMPEPHDCEECKNLRPGDLRCRRCTSMLIAEIGEERSIFKAALEEVVEMACCGDWPCKPAEIAKKALDYASRAKAERWK